MKRSSSGQLRRALAFLVNLRVLVDVALSIIRFGCDRSAAMVGKGGTRG